MNSLSKSLIDAALYYADLGFSVFPLIPGSKVPATEHGCLDATTDLDQIEAWWVTQPSANIGISTDGLFVVDIDGADNSWPGDPDRIIDLACTAVSLTPNGGSHHIFRQPKGRDWHNTASKLAHKVDTRATGGYIVAPPSTIGGKSYQWAETMALRIMVSDLPEPPVWLARAIEDATAVKPGAVRTPGNVIPDGQRNDTLARLAGSMRRVGMGEAEILPSLLEINSGRCVPPLSSREVSKIASSVCRYEPDQITVATVEGHWAQDSAALVPEVIDPGAIPIDLLRIPGLISEIMDYTLATAPYPNVAMAFAGALALQATLAGRKVRDPGDNRTNLYILALAHSASGKDRPRKVNAEIMHALGLSGAIGGHFASGEGVQDAMFLEPCMLFQTDEIDGMLQSITKAKDARHESIMNTLLIMYSSANSVFPMRRKAGPEAAGSINQPCLNILGTAIPNHYYQALSERMLTNGFFARMLVIESIRRGEGQEPKILGLPSRILDTARWWATFTPGGNLSGVNPSPETVHHTAKASAMLVEARLEAEAEYDKAEAANDSVGTTVWGRVSENVRKLALIYAISRDHLKPVIDVKSVEWAQSFVTHQTRRMVFMASTKAVESQFHAECLKAIEALKAAPGRELLHGALLRKLRLNAKSFADLITTLEQRGDIITKIQSSGGRPGRFYTLNGGVQ